MANFQKGELSFKWLVRATCLLALGVIMLGAYVRLSDAGLGCPDWPGCYGFLTIPQTADEVKQATEIYPERPVEAAKAWKEMVHRYLASVLGLMIIAIAVIAVVRRKFDSYQPIKLPLILIPLVLFQGALGAWTVTLQLKPVIVMGHLLGGLSILSILWWLVLESSYTRSHKYLRINLSRLWLYGIVGVGMVAMQIALGGWTSANYAALACIDFPLCQGKIIPAMDFSEGFKLWRGTGVNYEFGILDSAARTAVHWTHRVWAIVVSVYLLSLAYAGYKQLWGRRGLWVVWAITAALLAQVTLGISNIVFALPLWVAVSHNGMAAILLLMVLSLVFILTKERSFLRRK